MELPPYRMPVLKSTFIHMWEKGSTFLTRAGTTILAGAALIWFFTHYPGVTNKEIASEHASKHAEVISQSLAPEDEQRALEALDAEHQAQILNTSFAASFGRAIQPALRPIFDPDQSREDAWKDGVALTAGFVAKEIVVSTVAIMYQAPISNDEEHGANGGALTNALARDSGMAPLTAISFLVFFLLYVPCLATLSMIYKETRSILWSAFSVAYGLALAWGMSWIVIAVGKMVAGP
jgi:ferrous iron transport protein B